MNIIIFGAAGGIGRQIVEQALAAGHTVTGVARHPEKINLRHDHLQIIRGDVLDYDSISQPITGKDAVISAIGVNDTRPTVLYSQGLANIIRAMQADGIRRLICVSASGLEPGQLWMRLIAKPLLWKAFKESYSDLVRMETVVKNSGLDWTIVRPPRLTNGLHTGRYDTAINQHLMHGWHISRADVADYILKELNDPAAYHALTEIAY